MRIALDTNRLTDLFQRDSALAAFPGTCDEVWIPFVVLAEMKAGFYGGTRQAYNEALLANLLSRETVAVVFASRETTSTTPGYLSNSNVPERPCPITICGSPQWHWKTIWLSLRGTGTSISFRSCAVRWHDRDLLWRIINDERVLIAVLTARNATPFQGTRARPGHGQHG